MLNKSIGYKIISIPLLQNSKNYEQVYQQGVP